MMIIAAYKEDPILASHLCSVCIESMPKMFGFAQHFQPKGLLLYPVLIGQEDAISNERINNTSLGDIDGF